MLADPLLVTSANTVWKGDEPSVTSTLTFSAKAPDPNNDASARSTVNVVSPPDSVLEDGEVLLRDCLAP